MSKSLEGVLVKKAHSKTTYTDDQVRHLSQCLDPETGPLYFMQNFFYIQHPTRGGIQFQPFDYQIELIRNYTDYRFSINMLGRQMGKALALDTPILTPSGFVQLGSLAVGDTIYGQDGRPTKVTFITETMHNRPCYTIEFMHGDTVIADAEHLWTIVHPKKGEMTVTTVDLISMVDNMPKTQSLHIKMQAKVQFNTVDLPIDPYYLGLWLGDGGSKDLRITCSHDDYIEYKRIFGNKGLETSDFTIYTRSKTTGSFYLKGGASKFKEIGVWRNKHIPHDYLFNSVENRLELLRGLMDSDGTVEQNGACRFYQSDEAFIDQVRFLLSSLGIKSTKGKRETSHKDSFTLCFSPTDRVCSLPRKLARQSSLHNHPKNKRIYIRSIVPTNSVPVRCLQVDNADHLFLCGKTLIPTHNTTCAAGFLLWYAMFVPDSTILIASNKYTSAQEIMQRIRYAYENCPDFVRAGVIDYNKGSIAFDNGSRIVSATTTETTGRGMSISLLYCDEMAYVRPSIAREFWTSISPTLSTGGKAIITSTPNSDEDQFAMLWRGANDTFDAYGNETGIGKNGFRAMLATWDRHPDRNSEWAERERSSIGEDRFEREHQCRFVIFDETLISPSRLNLLEGIQPLEKQGQVRWYSKPKPGHVHAIALDPSLGTGGDNAAIQLFDITTMTQVAEWQHNLTPIQKQVGILTEICRYLAEELDDPTQIYYTVENNTLGEAALNAIADIGEENIPGVFFSEPSNRAGPARRHRKGLTTGHKNKLAACAKMKSWIESNKMTVCSKSLVSELKNFVAVGNSFRAKTGETDDLVSAALLIVRMAMLIKNYYQDMSDTLRDGLEDVISPMPFIIM